MSRKSDDESQRDENSASSYSYPSNDDFLLNQLVQEEGGYPGPEERETFLQRREEISRQIIEVRADNGGLEVAQLRFCLEKFGARDLYAVLNARMNCAGWPQPIQESAWFYRKYRQAFALYGAHRFFLSRGEFETTLDRLGRLSTWHLLMSHDWLQQRERKLRDLLLIDQMLWHDLQPLAPPPRPAEFSAPQPQEYYGPERELLEWGPYLNPELVQHAARNARRWRGARIDLFRMAFDEGLLAGWPGKPPSWAPYYAVRLLGELRAAEFAAPLLALGGRPDDWLSDCLPDAWAMMGKKAMPALWKIIDNQDHGPHARALAASGLYKMADAQPDLRSGVFSGFTDRLSASGSDDSIFNAHLVMNLYKLYGEEADNVLLAAFERGAVDLKFFLMGSVDLMDWGVVEIMQAM